MRGSATTIIDKPLALSRSYTGDVAFADPGKNMLFADPLYLARGRSRQIPIGVLFDVSLPSRGDHFGTVQTKCDLHALLYAVGLRIGAVRYVLKRLRCDLPRLVD